VYHIIDFGKKVPLFIGDLKQWNSIHFRQFWEAIFVGVGKKVRNDYGSYCSYCSVREAICNVIVVCVKQYAMFQTEIRYLNN
jgi:hypothetical protein